LNYIDAHLHLADSGYSGLIQEVMDDAAKNGVHYLLSNGMDYDSSVKTLALADQYKNRVLAAVGLHPWTAANTNGKLALDIFEQLVDENRKKIRR